jgi:hypothetical protein
VQLHLQGSTGKTSYQVSGFEVKYPPDFKGVVALDAGKVYAATGTNGRVSFAYNPTQGAEELAGPADEPEDDPSAASAAAVDQDFEAPRARVTARSGGAEPQQPQGDQAMYGRKKRKQK